MCQMSPLQLRRGVHRLQRRMDVDAGGVLRLHHLGRRAERRRRIAVLDEELPGIVEALQPLGFIEQRLARQFGVGTAVIADLQRLGGLCGIGIGIGHRHHPAGGASGLVVERDGLDEARHFLRRTVVDRFDRGAEAHRRRDDLAVDHARQHDVDAVFGCAVGLRGNIELRHRDADHGVLIGRLKLDRLQFVRRKGLGRLAALDDVGERHRLLRLRMRDHGVADHQFARRHAHRGGGGLRQCHAPRGTRAAHRIEVHHRAPAAAGNLRAEHGIVELRIVGRELNPHVLPVRAEFLGDDLRHGRGNVLAHVGLAAGDRDDPVRRDRIPDAGIEIAGGGEAPDRTPSRPGTAE